MQPEILQHILLDIPSLAFFTTYTLLVLFWAEIYYQAPAVSTDGLRPSFFTINAVVYVIQLDVQLGAMVNTVSEFGLLGWFGRVKLINCICDLVLLNPQTGQFKQLWMVFWKLKIS